MDHLTRRGFVAGASALVPTLAYGADAKPILPSPPTVISNPPRVWGQQPLGATTIFPDPDVLVLDPSFNRLRIVQQEIKRLKTGFQWCEGPAWCSQGQFAVFSDVMGNIQWRYIWETGEFTPFRQPSMNTNGNTYDFQGREISCQDFTRRVVRMEHDGSMKILDNYQGKAFNSPNDLAPHPDGSIWFTDIPAGDDMSQGHPDEGDSAMNPGGLRNPHIGNPGYGLIGSLRPALPNAVYRWEPDTGKVDMVLNCDGGSCNGICFSPDYKLLYVIGREMVKGFNGIAVGDVQGTTVGPMRPYTDCMIDGVRCGPDGMRCDKAGNIWCGSTSILGYAGVTIWNPAGKAIGRIRLPETCANVCFAGPKRDYLFMAASQSIYMLRVNIQGASPG